MVTGGITADGALRLSGRRLPPIIPVAVTSMALVIVGVIYLAAYLPDTAPLAPAVGLLIAASALLVANVVMLARMRRFAWDRFFAVWEWTLLAYVIIAGMLEYVFVLDGMRGSLLAVMTMMLVVFTLDIPILLGFSVARFKAVE